MFGNTQCRVGALGMRVNWFIMIFVSMFHLILTDFQSSKFEFEFNAIISEFIQPNCSAEWHISVSLYSRFGGTSLNIHFRCVTVVGWIRDETKYLGVARSFLSSIVGSSFRLTIGSPFGLTKSNSL